MNEDLRNALAILNARYTAAHDKRDELEIQIRELDTEIANLNKAMSRVLMLMGMTQGEPISELGITDAIRRVTHFPQTRMTANQVREELEKQGFDLSGYQNPMASIYKILTRLTESGELEVEREGWNTFYKGKAKRRAALPSRRRPRQAFGAPPVTEET